MLFFILIQGVSRLPQTKKEEILFTCMMAFGMVFGMASYNAVFRLVLKSG